MRSLLLLLSSGIFFINVFTTSAQLLTRNCWFVTNSFGYSCDRLGGGITSENFEFVIGGNHTEGKSNEDVVNLSTNQYFEVFRREIMETFPNLQRVHMNYNSLRSLTERSFTTCSELRTVDFTFNLLVEITNGIFRNCFNLETLILQDNTIRSLQPLAFEGLGNLSVLNLGTNQLTTIFATTFKLLPNLRYLDLLQNQITDISENAFEFNENLRYLGLEGNLIESIGPSLFQNSSNLASLRVSGNRLISIHADAFSSCTNLVQLRLEWNRNISNIDFMATPALSNLDDLALGDNNITELPPRIFQHLTRLRLLDLINNKIKRLNSNAFTKMENLTDLILDLNNIDEIERNFFDNFPNVITLWAAYNECVDVRFFWDSTIDFSAFTECFRNWDSPRTTTMAMEPETTTGASAAVGSFLMISMTLLINVL